jgi:hypothetical protein
MAQQKWTQQEIEFLLKNYKHGYTANQCSEYLNRNIMSVRHKIRNLKLQNIRKPYNITTKKPDEYFVNPEQFLKLDSPHIAYVLGLLWGDGHINTNRNTIVLTCSRPDVDYFYTVFLKTGQWKFTPILKKQKSSEKDKATIITSNKPICDFLKMNDYISKSFESACQILNVIPAIYQHYFIRGLCDADGCFYYNRKTGKAKEFTLSSSFDQNWTYIENILTKLGISYRINKCIRKNQKSKWSRIRIKGINNIIKFGNYIYNNYNRDKIGLERKYFIFLNMINQNKHE